MPLSPNLIRQEIQTSGISDFSGPKFAGICLGIGIAVCAWSKIPPNLTLTGVTSGQIGGGVVIGQFTVAPNPLLIQQSLFDAGNKGPTSVPLAKAVALGIASAFSKSLYQGTSVGVALGTDTSWVSVSNPIPLIPLLQTALSGSLGGTGLSMKELSIGLANGITSMIGKGTGTGIVTGTPAPIPGIASGTSPLSLVF